MRAALWVCSVYLALLLPPSLYLLWSPCRTCPATSRADVGGALYLALGCRLPAFPAPLHLTSLPWLFHFSSPLPLLLSVYFSLYFY